MEGASKVFITGGVRSGKSSFAEKYAIEAAANTNGILNYIATGAPSDQEMKIRIWKHQRERAESGFSWKTWERSTHIGTLAPSIGDKDILLLDCLTTLLNNELFSFQGEWTEAAINDIYERILSGISAIRENCRMLIVVSNEVLNETYSDDHFLLIYRQLLGKLHREIVSKANKAYLVEAGVPVLMKDSAI